MGQFRASGTQAVSCSRQAPCAPVSLGTRILPLRSNDVLSSVSACQHHESFGGPGLRSLCSGLPALHPSSRGVISKEPGVPTQPILALLAVPTCVWSQLKREPPGSLFSFGFSAFRDGTRAQVVPVALDLRT